MSAPDRHATDETRLPAGEASSGRTAYRGPLQGLYDLAELLGGESPESRRFLRGLAIGALVGAALAGSSFLRRRRPAWRGQREEADPGGPKPDGGT